MKCYRCNEEITEAGKCGCPRILQLYPLAVVVFRCGRVGAATGTDAIRTAYSGGHFRLRATTGCAVAYIRADQIPAASKALRENLGPKSGLVVADVSREIFRDATAGYRRRCRAHWRAKDQETPG